MMDLGRLFPGAVIDTVTRLAGGVSADVRRLDLTLADGRKRSLVLRVHGKSHSGHPAELEFQLLEALYRHGMPVPEPLLADASGSLLPDPFVVMSFVPGDTTGYPTQEHCITAMADMLARIHGGPTDGLPTLPARNDPLPEVLDYLPEDSEWDTLRRHLRSLSGTAYQASPTLLHGDFWPANLIWRGGAIVAVLDWEDAAIGDPLSDLAASRLELRYQFGPASMQQLTERYAEHRTVDHDRLALWQVYVAAAALRLMGGWGLDQDLEAHMRNQALLSIREAGSELLDRRA